MIYNHQVPKFFPLFLGLHIFLLIIENIFICH